MLLNGISQKHFKNSAPPANRDLSVSSADGWSMNLPEAPTSQTSAMKLSAVNACVEVISNSISKLPIYIMNENTKERIDHPLLNLLERRPNELMAPSIFKKLVECNRLLRGNAYVWIVRSHTSGRVQELIPLPPDCVQIFIDDNGILWYIFTHPKTGKVNKLANADVLHYKAYSADGINGISVLQRAKEVISTAHASQKYEQNYYRQGSHLSGVLSTDGDLKDTNKDKLREEWQRIYSGADNAFRVAVLDLGLKFQAIGVTNRDSQFIEGKSVSVEDISRFFGVPLYKINAGKQSYSSNEQNAIEYVTATLHPIVTQYEQEDSYKLLFPSDVKKGLEIRRNMMAELRGDVGSRGNWYKSMREIGAFSANDIRALEDMNEIEGGDTRYASLNYVPLDLFSKLSIERNGGENKNAK